MELFHTTVALVPSEESAIFAGWALCPLADISVVTGLHVAVLALIVAVRLWIVLFEVPCIHTAVALAPSEEIAICGLEEALFPAPNRADRSVVTPPHVAVLPFIVAERLWIIRLDPSKQYHIAVALVPLEESAICGLAAVFPQADRSVTVSQFRSSANALPLTKSNITTHALKNLEATRNAKRVIVFNVCSTQAR